MTNGHFVGGGGGGHVPLLPTPGSGPANTPPYKASEEPTRKQEHSCSEVPFFSYFVIAESKPL